MHCTDDFETRHFAKLWYEPVKRPDYLRTRVPAFRAPACPVVSWFPLLMAVER